MYLLKQMILGKQSTNRVVALTKTNKKYLMMPAVN